MSSNTTEEEILESRGFKSDLLRIRGYSQYGYRDKSRDTLSALDIYDLEMKILVKNKPFRNYIIYDYKDNVVPVLGANHQVMMLDKDSHVYFDSELLYIPLRLVAKRWYNIPESELSLLEQESRQEQDTTFWAGEIPANDTPVRSLLEKVSPYMLEACHLFVEDPELNAKSEINNNPRSEDIEIFYKPFRNAAGHCWKWDCILCSPVQKFLEAYHKTNKKAKNWVLIGTQLDSKEAIRFDNLKGLEELIKIASMAFNVFNVNTSIWDTWSRLDGELDN